MIRRSLAIPIALLVGCSTLDLDGDLLSAPCASDDACAHLESLSPSGTCEAWRCLGSRCVVAVEDADQDGFASAVCTGEATDDCDDSDPTVAPGRDETTNGHDDDCNGIADDVELLHGSTRSLHSSLSRVRVVSATRSATLDAESVVVVEIDTNGDSGLVSLVHPGETDGVHPFVRNVDATELPLLVRDVATTQLTSTTHALAVVPDGECRRVALGFADEENLPTHRLVATFFDLGGIHYARGLPDDAGNDCNSSTSPHARSPAIAASGLDLVVAWLGADALSGRCDAIVDAPILVHRARIAGTGLTFPPEASLRVGKTDDASPPALAAIGAAEFLGVHVDDHELVFTRFVIANGDLLATELGRFDGSAPGMEIHRPRLAVGDTSETVTSIAVSYVEGACESGDVRVRRFDLVRSDATMSVSPASATADSLGAGGATASHAEAVVHAATPSAYFSFWIDHEFLSVRGVDRFGHVFGGSTPHPIESAVSIDSLGSVAALASPPWRTPGLSAYVVATLASGVDVLFEHTIEFP